MVDDGLSLGVGVGVGLSFSLCLVLCLCLYLCLGLGLGLCLGLGGGAGGGRRCLRCLEDMRSQWYLVIPGSAISYTQTHYTSSDRENFLCIEI